MKDEDPWPIYITKFFLLVYTQVGQVYNSFGFYLNLSAGEMWKHDSPSQMLHVMGRSKIINSNEFELGTKMAARNNIKCNYHQFYMR